jgi:hypothetical protein
LWSRLAWAKNITKITKAKRSGGLAEGVEHLDQKYKALNSNPSTAKTNQTPRTFHRETTDSPFFILRHVYYAQGI